MSLKLNVADRQSSEPVRPDAARHFEQSAFGASPPPRGQLRFVVGERQHRLYPLEAASIDCIEANGNYVTIRSGKSLYISRDSIKHLAVYLADQGFLRIQRSVLLRIQSILYAQAAGHGTFAFTLQSGACVYSTPSYRESILEVLPLEPCARRNARNRA